jgi:hypothetical protein
VTATFSASIPGRWYALGNEEVLSLLLVEGTDWFEIDQSVWDFVSLHGLEVVSAGARQHESGVLLVEAEYRRGNR